MNRINVKLEDGNLYNSGASIYLDIDDGRKPRLAFDIENYARILGVLNIDAAEFAYFTSVIYACDRAINREMTYGDRWTREIFVCIPVTDPNRWNHAKKIAESTLEFLTGDIWHLDFTNSTVPLLGTEFNWKRMRIFRKKKFAVGSAVSLFSGGLDSLIGIINWLEDNPAASLILASTYDAQAEGAKCDQKRLLEKFPSSYKDRLQHYVARTGLCTDGQDKNFRSRSLAFIGNAVLAASFLGPNVPIIIPENGAIAINFPLSPAREGSLSTRTVHPYFLQLLNKLLAKLNLQYTITNPYQFLTKGEMMQQCKNINFLKTIYMDSVSCGKRGFDRQYWTNKSARGCGACVPCIYRRAAIFKAGFSSEQYGYELENRNTWQRDILAPNSDLQSIIDFIRTGHSARDIWQIIRSNGKLDIRAKDDYVSLVQRLREEVCEWCCNMNLM